MGLRLHNTYTRSLEPFVPLDPSGRTVLFYSCGPTVYSYAHIGNFRSFLLADLLARTLRRRGFDVRQVMNITDVGHMTEDHLADATGEDKLSKAARELGRDPFQVARHFESMFAIDARAIRLAIYEGAAAGDPTLHPRATRYLPEMLEAIQRLLDHGYAYVDNQGQAYFEIARFAEYGQLSGKVIDELEPGARVEVRDEKRDPHDFALWKVDPQHLMQWDPHAPDGWEPEDWARLERLVPGGVDRRLARGFPGWHIECSAMARACLGPVIDLHSGGEDNIFPHHECEIAQSYGAYGTVVPAPEGERRSFSRVWVHGRHLLVNGRKMSKRDGSFFTVRDLLDPGPQRPDLIAPLEALGFAGGRVPAPVLRWALLSTHYRLPLNFSFDLLVSARAAVQRLQSRYDRLRELEDEDRGAGAGAVSDAVAAALDRGRARFDDALDDDLDIAAALAALLDLFGELNVLSLGPADAAAARAFLEELDGVVAVLDRSRRAGLLERERMTRWRDPGFRTAQAQALAGWRELADRAPLVAALERGELPSADELAAVADLDEAVLELAVAAREHARASRDFARADQLRDLLRTRQVTVDDTPQGVRWHLP